MLRMSLSRWSSEKPHEEAERLPGAVLGPDRCSGFQLQNRNVNPT